MFKIEEKLYCFLILLYSLKMHIHNEYNDNSYQENKMKYYKELGYKTLFFREDAIHDKLDIIG